MARDSLRLGAAALLLAACTDSTAPKSPRAGMADVTISGDFDTHRTDVRARFEIAKAPTSDTIRLYLSWPALPNSTAPQPEILTAQWPTDSLGTAPQTIKTAIGLAVVGPRQFLGRYINYPTMATVRVEAMNDSVLAGSVDSPMLGPAVVHVSGSFTATICHGGEPRFPTVPCADWSPD